MASSGNNNNQQEDPWAELYDRAEGKIAACAFTSVGNTTLKDDVDDDNDDGDQQDTAADESSASAKRPKLNNGTKTASKKASRRNAGNANNYKNINNDNGASFQKYLQERSSFQTNLRLKPSCIVLKEAFILSSSSAAGSDIACQEWKGGAPPEGQQQQQRSKPSHCQSCGRSSFYHRASVKKDNGNNNHVPLQLYCLLRNLRHVAVLFLTTNSSTRATNSFFVVDRALLCECQRLLKILQRVAVSQPELASSLQTKFATLHTLLHQQHQAFQKRKKQNTTSSNNISNPLRQQQQAREGAIRIIMQCDECYYQLYYLEITRQVSGLFFSFQQQQQRAGGKYIPHPTVYFGESFTAMNETGTNSNNNHQYYLDAARDWVSASWKSLDHRHSSAVARFQLDFEQAMGKSAVDLDALSALHYIRFLETISFFDLPTGTSWLAASSSSASSSLLSKGENTSLSSSPSLTAPPPAPALLMEWRDSCRDFLTHLYAYATLPPNLISFILKTCRDEEIHNIIEVGAGTGYVAQLLNVQQQQKDDVCNDIIGVEAYDLLPTTPPGNSANAAGMNEYHGDTPPFTHVAKASCTQALRNNIGINNSTTALLLCYPPPDSSMALDAVQMFCRSMNGSSNNSSSGRNNKKRRRQRQQNRNNDDSTALDTATSCNAGSLVIHIGEFQGLTGTRELERYLVRHFDCIARNACPTWGTDATSVTIWKVRKHAISSPSSSPSSSSSMLIPCHYCHVKPATKRLRCIRHLEYCSNACFQADCQSGIVYQHAKCSRLYLSGGDGGITSTAEAATSALDFENRQHFLNLSY